LSPYSAFVSSLSSVSIPKTTGETLSYLGWHQVMLDEIDTLHSNVTWDLVSLPPGKTLVGCSWIFTPKVDLDGQVEHLKARLVAKDFTQIYGLNYNDTLSPVAKMASVYLFLSLGCYASLATLSA